MKLKKLIIKVVEIILIILILSLLNSIMKKSDEEFMKGCLESGNSYNYCISHK